MSLADNPCKQFRPRSGPTKSRAWSGSNLFDTLIVFMKEIKKWFWNKKNQQTTKTSCKITQKVMTDRAGYHMLWLKYNFISKILFFIDFEIIQKCFNMLRVLRWTVLLNQATLSAGKLLEWHDTRDDGMEGRLLVLVTLAVVGLLVEHSPVIAQGMLLFLLLKTTTTFNSLFSSPSGVPWRISLCIPHRLKTCKVRRDMALPHSTQYKIRYFMVTHLVWNVFDTVFEEWFCLHCLFTFFIQENHREILFFLSTTGPRREKTWFILLHANNRCTDQTAHSHSFTSIFVFRVLISILAKCVISPGLTHCGELWGSWKSEVKKQRRARLGSVLFHF